MKTAQQKLTAIINSVETYGNNTLITLIVNTIQRTYSKIFRPAGMDGPDSKYHVLSKRLTKLQNNLPSFTHDKRA